MTLSDPYTQTYSSFYVACLDPEGHEKTCDYWYTVHSGAYNHTAFHTKEALLDWLTERGLTLKDTLPEERGTYKWIHVNGTYRSSSYLDVKAFLVIVPILKVAVLSNANYTLGKVTQDEQGIRTVHYLNPNCKERIVFPYGVMRDRKDGFKQMIQDSPDIHTREGHREEPWDSVGIVE